MSVLLKLAKSAGKVFLPIIFSMGLALSGETKSDNGTSLSDSGFSRNFSFNNGALKTRGYYSTRGFNSAALQVGPQKWAQRSLAPEMQTLDYSELQVDYGLSRTELHFANAKSDSTSLVQLGFSRNSLRFDAFGGNGETVSGLRSRYNGIDPFLFHGGVEQDYQYSGLALGYKMGKAGALNLAQARITSSGLDDRSVQRLGYINGAMEMSYTRVLRGTESMGSAYAVSAGLGKFRFGFDYLHHDNGSRFQSALLTTLINGVRYSARLQSANNSLYSRKNENRLMFSVGFTTRGGKRWLHNSETLNEGVEGDGEQDVAVEGSNGNKYLIGGALVGAGLAMSSGSSSSDEAQRFSGQHGAAFDVLNRINPRSVAENREYGGYVYRNADGSFSSTSPVKGTVNSVSLPPISSVTPAGSSTRASYHTHAGPDPRYDNENFSSADILADIQFGLDGYLGTPAGRFRFHDVSAGTITTLGTIAN